MRSLSLIFLLFTNFALNAQILLSQAALKIEFDGNVQNTGWSEASIFAHGLEFSSGFDKRR